MDFFKKENGFIKIELNPKLYNLEAAYSAAYQMMENAFIYFEGDPDIKIIVNIGLKDDLKDENNILETKAKEYLNHLVNYSHYKINSKNKEILRTLLLKKSFTSIELDQYDEGAAVVQDKCCDGNQNDANFDNGLSKDENAVFDDDFNFDEDDKNFEFDDPEGIAIPWEEKYGDKNEN